MTKYFPIVSKCIRSDFGPFSTEQFYKCYTTASGHCMTSENVIYTEEQVLLSQNILNLAAVLKPFAMGKPWA